MRSAPCADFVVFSRTSSAGRPSPGLSKRYVHSPNAAQSGSSRACSSRIGRRARRPSRKRQTDTHACASFHAETSSSAPALPRLPDESSTWTTSPEGAGAFADPSGAPSAPVSSSRTAPRSGDAETVSLRPSPSKSAESVGPRGLDRRSASSAAMSAGAATAVPPSSGRPPRPPRSRCASACRRRTAC